MHSSRKKQAVLYTFHAPIFDEAVNRENQKEDARRRSIFQALHLSAYIVYHSFYEVVLQTCTREREREEARA